MSTLRVLVCGTNYGRIYLEAVRLGGADYRLVGVLARGNPRSQQIARAYGVPLYCRVEDLGANIDLACAAVGTAGSGVVLRLLAHGVHVLCEHPQRQSFIQSALDAAASHAVRFHINGHFADLDAASAFIGRCRQQNESKPPSFFDVIATDRSLYAALDILGRILISFEPFEFQVSSRMTPFTVVQGLLSGIPVTFHIQRGGDGRRAFPDGSPSYLVDHRIAVGFRSGILTLLSMNGPVVWNANLNGGVTSEQPLFTVMHEDRELTAEQLHQQRVGANLRAIEAMAKDVSTGLRPPEQAPNYLLEVSRVWESVGGLL